MRPIDADALKEKKVYCVERHEKVVPVAEIDWMPTLDAVPVVRCKDCAKWDKSTMEHYEDVFSGSGDTAECRMFCDMDTWGEFTDDMRRTDGNWFCADGEPKEDA